MFDHGKRLTQFQKKRSAASKAKPKTHYRHREPTSTKSITNYGDRAGNLNVVPAEKIYSTVWDAILLGTKSKKHGNQI